MSSIDDELSRRHFLKLMGASIALAGASACTKMPAEKIIPYVISPRSPGQKRYFASFTLSEGFAKGILVESHENRPTKIEGSPLHPASLGSGSTDIFAQAEILSLYDPERSQSVTHRGETSHWDACIAEISRRAAAWKKNQGEGLAIVSEPLTSPTLIARIEKVLAAFPKAKWYAYDPLRSQLPDQAALAAFGEIVRPIYHFSCAKTVLSLDADFLASGPALSVHAREFTQARSSGARLHMIDSSVTITGASAHSRLPVKPSQVEALSRALAKRLGLALDAPSAPDPSHERWIAKVSDELLASKGASLVIAGPNQSVATQILAHAINDHLKSHGNTVRYIASAGGKPSGHAAELLDALSRGEVQSLFILGGNPAYDLPGSSFEKVDFSVRLGPYNDETSSQCQWHLPETHFLETWGDALAFDGTVSFQQPLIAPLYDAKSAAEVLGFLLPPSERLSPRQLLAAHWKSDFTDQAIGDGLIAGTQARPTPVKLKSGWNSTLSLPTVSDPNGLEIGFRADPTIGSGKYSNNAWLQELPKPLLQLTWGNAAILSPATATQLGLENEDLVTLKAGGRSISACVLTAPGHPNGVITAHLGYGRTKAGRVGNGHGFNAYALMSSAHQAYASGAELASLHKKGELALTHAHSKMEGRELVRKGAVPDEARASPATLLVDYPSAGEAWAMVIDLNSCIGCNACTIACQAENNIPIVGKDQVRLAREMHWIRVDRYFEGSADNPRVYFQPVPCMHCEKAPCEEVCPTAATNHSHDGLNQMIYNRCVGTRYCSNNCPYKVRRFNFFAYDQGKPLARLMQNPDVTVRSRGVMEKCTYCIQRIQEVRIEAEKMNRQIKDGEIITACQGVCPTRAITFGNQNDPESRVAKLKRLPSNYSLLGELGTRPRTTYLTIATGEEP